MSIYNDIILVNEGRCYGTIFLDDNAKTTQDKKKINKKHIKSFDIVDGYINITFSDCSREHIDMKNCSQVIVDKEKYMILDTKRSYYILHLVRHKLIDNIQTFDGIINNNTLYVIVNSNLYILSRKEDTIIRLHRNLNDKRIITSVAKQRLYDKGYYLPDNMIEKLARLIMISKYKFALYRQN